MAELQITSEFDNRSFVPGDAVRGEVSWQNARIGPPPDAVELRLFYYTTGKGTRDVEIVETKRFENPSPSDRQPFEFRLPAGPYSFSGKLVSLIWALELQLGNSGATERFEFTLSPTGREINLYAHAGAELPKHSSF